MVTLKRGKFCSFSLKVTVMQDFLFIGHKNYFNLAGSEFMLV